MTVPPGELMYMLMGRSGSCESRKSSWAITLLAIMGFICSAQGDQDRFSGMGVGTGEWRQMMRSFKSRE